MIDVTIEYDDKGERGEPCPPVMLCSFDIGYHDGFMVELDLVNHFLSVTRKRGRRKEYDEKRKSLEK